MTSWPDHFPSGNQNRFWRNGNQIDTAFILARSDFVKVCVYHQTVINPSQIWYRLGYFTSEKCSGSAYGSRTRVPALRGLCPNH